MQEFQTAKQAILAAIPNANVQGKYWDAYPITVAVKHKASGQTVWSGDQRSLFRKNAARRAASQQAITQACAALKAA